MTKLVRVTDKLDFVFKAANFNTKARALTLTLLLSRGGNISLLNAIEADGKYPTILCYLPNKAVQQA